MNIFEALREDHKKQRTLVEILVKTHGDSEGRREIFDRLKAELQHHATAEERYFYVPLMESDLSQDQARHSVAEHHEIDEIIEELEETDLSSPGWLAAAKRLREEVLHHLDEEEQQVFQLAGKVFSEGQKTSLATEYRKEMTAQEESA